MKTLIIEFNIEYHLPEITFCS